MGTLPLPAERVGRDVQPHHPVVDDAVVDGLRAHERDAAIDLDAVEVQVGARRVDPGLTPSAVGRVTDGQAAADQPAVGVTAVERFLDDAVIEDPPDRIRPLAAARPGDVPCPDPEIEGTVSQRSSGTRAQLSGSSFRDAELMQ